MAKKKTEQEVQVDVLSPEIIRIAEEYGVNDKNSIMSTTKGIELVVQDRIPLEQEYQEVCQMDIEDPATWKKARELRIKIRDNRTKGINVWHKSAKEFFLSGGRFVDAIKNLQSGINEKMEDMLDGVEKLEERRKQEAKEKLRKEREAETIGLESYMPKIDHSVLEESDFNMILEMARTKKANEEAEEQKRVQEEQERERIAKRTYERRLEAAKYAIVIPEEELSSAISNHSDEEFSDFKNEAELLLKKKQEEAEQARKAAEEEKKRREAAEAAAEKERQETQRKLDEENARRDKELAEAKSRAEEAEKARKEAEAKAKKAEEEAMRSAAYVDKNGVPVLDQDARKPTELNSGRVSNFEAAISSAVTERDGIEGWVDLFQAPYLPAELAADGRTIEILNKFEGFKTWALKLAKQ